MREAQLQFNLFPLPPCSVPLTSSSNVACYLTPTKWSGALNSSAIPVAALLIRILVRPHTLRCLFRSHRPRIQAGDSGIEGKKCWRAGGQFHYENTVLIQGNEHKIATVMQKLLEDSEKAYLRFHPIFYPLRTLYVLDELEQT